MAAHGTPSAGRRKGCSSVPGASVPATRGAPRPHSAESRRVPAAGEAGARGSCARCARPAGPAGGARPTALAAAEVPLPRSRPGLSEVGVPGLG